jgi:hypothetical protein
MANIATRRSVRSASWLFLIACAALLVAGCEIVPPRVERDGLYPPDWPDTVGSGENCRGIEGTFENKGALVEEKQYDSSGRLVSRESRIRTALLSDMFRMVGSQQRSDQAALVALQRCERISLSVEPYSQPISEIFDWKVDRLMLSITGTQPVDSEPAVQGGPCAASLRVGYNECKDGVFVNRVAFYMWAVEVGRDDSLVVDRRLLRSCNQLTCSYDRVIGRFKRVR